MNGMLHSLVRVTSNARNAGANALFAAGPLRKPPRPSAMHPNISAVSASARAATPGDPVDATAKRNPLNQCLYNPHAIASGDPTFVTRIL